MLEALSSAFESLRKYVAPWLLSLLQPLPSVLAIVEAPTKIQALRKSYNLWSASLTISLILQLPNFLVAGVSLSSVFVRFGLTASLFLFLLVGGVIYGATMEYYGVSVSGLRGVAVYTVVICAYAPFLSVLMVPLIHDTVTSSISGGGSSLSVGTARFIFSVSRLLTQQNGNGGWFTLESVFLPFLIMFQTIPGFALAVVTEKTAKPADRAQVYVPVAIFWLLFLTLSFFLALAVYAVIAVMFGRS